MAEDIRTIALGPLDHIASSNIPQSIIYLSLKEGTLPQDAFNCLRAGLHRTLVQTPWLAGRVHYQSQGTPGWRPGQLEVRYPSNAITLSNQSSAEILRFNKLDTPLSFADLRETGFPLDSFDDQVLLWTSPFEPDYEAGANVLAAQANFIPGGCLLVLSVAASVSDGTAMLTITKIWADYCNTAFGQSNDLAVVRPRFTTDRALLDRLLQEERKRQSDGHCKDGGSEIAQLVGLDHAPKATPSGSNSGLMKPRIFYMPQSAYTALRKECTKEFGAAEISGNDLICALIFRSLIRASTSLNVRESNGTAPKVASLSLPFDGRPKLLQSMDTLYLGNMNFENRLTVPVEILIASTTSIPWVAKAINAHAESSAHPSALLAAYDLARSATKYDNHNGLCAARMSPASASVGVMSPMTLPFNDTCFGKQVFGNNGNPEGFRPLMGSCNRSYRTCFVIPRKKAGGIEFVMTLYEEEMDFLSADDEFSRYAFSLS
ncbi:hypothetical protein N7523_011058 [Penicillium sp. IBT 18751x]|nr:hypothetical protein N7523_011058 [Penicillium sp. IBT 18751x]